MQKANYGLDAPGVVRNFVLLAVGLIGAGVALRMTHTPLRGLGRALWFPGAWFGLTALVMLWSSYSGKFLARDRLLDRLPWRGDERVLDVGCGHGLMLIGAAKRLTTGKAIGVDLWQNEDQKDNSAAATQRNVELEGVADRVEIRDGDARKLPFDDASFDVVVSSFVVHNIYDADGRDEAISEIVRVLRPGGYAAIIDIRHDYEKLFAARGCDIIKTTLSLLFALPTRSVVARKR